MKAHEHARALGYSWPRLRVLWWRFFAKGPRL